MVMLAPATPAATIVAEASTDPSFLNFIAGYPHAKTNVK
jgi:hypothetical protein